MRREPLPVDSVEDLARLLLRLLSNGISSFRPPKAVLEKSAPYLKRYSGLGNVPFLAATCITSPDVELVNIVRS